MPTRCALLMCVLIKSSPFFNAALKPRKQALDMRYFYINKLLTSVTHGNVSESRRVSAPPARLCLIYRL